MTRDRLRAELMELLMTYKYLPDPYMLPCGCTLTAWSDLPGDRGVMLTPHLMMCPLCKAYRKCGYKNVCKHAQTWYPPEGLLRMVEELPKSVFTDDQR